MSRRDRERRPARRAVPIEQKRRFLVVSEGEVTERQYLEGFRDHCRNPLVALRYEGAAGVPMTLVKRARDLRNEADDRATREADDNLRYDEVWCVFDVDEHPRVAEARAMAQANGLRLAMTNPCFELWLLLHLRESPGPQTRHAVQRMLQDLMPNVRPKHIDFKLLIAGYEGCVPSRIQAVERRARSGRAPTKPVH